MKISLIAVLLTIGSSACAAETAAIDAPQSNLSFRDQIKAARAKDKADEKADQTKRSWDRDSNGKRPWDTSTAPERETK